MAALPARRLAYLLPVLHVDSVIIIALCVFISVPRGAEPPGVRDVCGAGTPAVIIAASLDIVAVTELIPNTVEYLPWGIMLYCVIQTVGMSRDFIRIQHRSRHLE
jgi:hypothetical protein